MMRGNKLIIVDLTLGETSGLKGTSHGCREVAGLAVLPMLRWKFYCFDIKHPFDISPRETKELNLNMFWFKQVFYVELTLYFYHTSY